MLIFALEYVLIVPGSEFAFNGIEHPIKQNRPRGQSGGKQDFVYLADEDVYRCPAGEKLKYRFTAEEHGQKLHRYWTDACQTCPIKAQCTTGRERRITRWEHEEVVEAVAGKARQKSGCH